jgi:membrane-associated phospholipid phosphatase
MANGATRLQPLVLNIGQAAGLAAALCVRDGVELAALPVRRLQEALIADPVAPAAVVPLWDTPWHHPLWHERGAPLLSEWNGHLPLPIAEGSPLHPSWISGHAATAAAEAVILMAGIADSPWPGVPLQASLDGTSLIPTSTTALTIHRELRKFAWNKSFGRVALGVHYRSDITAGLMLGQAAAVDLLRQVKAHSVEPWGTTAFIGFDGKVVTI